MWPGWRQRTELPICVGFGISQPEHVRTLAEVADGLIVGSAFVRRIETAAREPRQQVLGEIGRYAAELLDALASATRLTRLTAGDSARWRTGRDPLDLQ